MKYDFAKFIPLEHRLEACSRDYLPRRTSFSYCPLGIILESWKNKTIKAPTTIAFLSTMFRDTESWARIGNLPPHEYDRICISVSRFIDDWDSGRIDDLYEAIVGPKILELEGWYDDELK